MSALGARSWVGLNSFLPTVPRAPLVDGSWRARGVWRWTHRVGAVAVQGPRGPFPSPLGGTK